jgi:menaquinone-dependent protoporphyrinogen oxidase
MKMLLVYGTTEGQTEKISKYVANCLAQRGHQYVLMNASGSTRAADVRDFDAVIIAASVHAGRYQPAIIHYVREHLAAIGGRPNAFLSVSLAAAGDNEDDGDGLKKCVADFARETKWTPQNVHHVAGALRYTSYNLLTRWAMQYIAYRKGGPTDASRDYELTDWADLGRFVDLLVNRVEFASAGLPGCGFSVNGQIPDTRAVEPRAGFT